MTKQVLLMVLAIAIMMVVSTTVANCQAVAGKALKVAKEAFKMSKELGISNSTYTKIGYAIKSIYDDIDKQRREQREQIVKSHAILQMVEHNDIVVADKLEKSKLDIKTLQEELKKPKSHDIKVVEPPKSPKGKTIEEYDCKIKNISIYDLNPCKNLNISFNTDDIPMTYLTMDEKIGKIRRPTIIAPNDIWSNLSLTEKKWNHVNY